MNVIRMIAWREYMENVKTRGFWIGIMLVPVMVIGMYYTQTNLARNTPTRYYILVDQSGRYDGAVQAAIDLAYQAQLLQNLTEYFLANRRATDLELVPAGSASTAATDELLLNVDNEEVVQFGDWIESGGIDFALTMLAPNLRDNAPPFEQPSRRFVEAPVPAEIDTSANPVQIVEQLRPFLNGDRALSVDGRNVELFALILIPSNVDDYILRPGMLPNQSIDAHVGIQYWARNLADTRLSDAVERGINNQVRNEELVRNGVNTSVVRNIQRTNMPFSKLDPDADEGEEAVSMADTYRQFAPVFFVYFMFIALMQSVQYLLTNTIEEKSNRILEVLLASVTPDELLIGKMLGIGLSSLTTLAAWILSMVLFLNLYDSLETNTLAEILQLMLSSELIPWFVFYCLAGYALYAGIFLAIGSLCNTLKDAQGMMVPVIVVMIVPIIITPFVVMDPSNFWFRVMSWFPLFTPYLMMNRAAANPPMVDVVGTTLVLILSVIFVLWLSGRIFRQGLLRTGQPPKILELWRMLRTS